jgi:endonuclease/exonuclease/phosphatase family metal-dependent hydrolase
MEDFKFATFNIHHGKDKATIYSHKEMLESVSSIDAYSLYSRTRRFSLRTYFADQPKLIAKNLIIIM